ncbi:hypothetical protein FRC02_012118 [Tulasnella sp. 418]|nr:hypothetical protein FRC02_012118 [Tulasnella sp. 418]
MTKWLSTQEAIQKQKVYLVWLGELDAQDIDGRGNNGDDELEDKSTAVGSDGTSSELEEEEDGSNMVKLNGSELILLTQPSNPLTTLTDVTSKYGAVDFISCLTEFLKANLPPHQFHQPTFQDKFDLYKVVHFSVPFLTNSSDSFIDQVRASPAIPKRHTAYARIKAKPAHFDTVLVKTGYKGPGHSEQGQGYRVVQVQAMFTVPKNLANYPHPLAYVEYFTNFTWEANQ